MKILDKKALILTVLSVNIYCALTFSITLASKYEGKPISSIEFLMDGLKYENRNLPRLKTKTSGPFKANDLNYDIESLFATGLFSDIRVSANLTADDRLIIKFNLTKAYFIESIEFEGKIDISSDKLREEVNIPFMTRFDESTAAQGISRLLAFLETEGYFNASINWVFNRSEDTNTGTLIFRINSGDPGIITDIDFSFLEGVPVGFRIKELDIEGIKSFTGNRLSTSDINKWLEQTQATLWEKGYITTDLDYLGESHSNNGKEVTLKFKLATNGLIELSFNEKDINSQIFKDLLEGKPIKRLSAETQLEWDSLIQDYYRKKGYSEVNVYSSVFPLEKKDNIFNIKVNRIQFLIKKGNKKIINDISFSGNQAFNETELKFILVAEKELVKGEIILTPDRLDQWAEQILAFYRSKGYLDARIIKTDTSEKQKAGYSSIYVIFFIEENNTSKIKEITIEGAPEIDKTGLVDVLGMEVGEIFLPSVLERATSNLRNFLSKKSDSEFNVNASVHKDDKDNAFITIRIEKVEDEIIDQLILNGNFRTDKEYILNNISLLENSRLTRSALLSSQLKLYDLGLFSKVEFTTFDEDIISTKKRLLLKIQESLPMQVTYGGGIDTENLIRGTFSISHNNLGGSGKKADFRVLLGSRESAAQLNYHIPQVFENTWDLFASIFYEEHKRESFGVTRRGAVLQLSNKKTANLTYLISFNVENVDLYDVKISEYLIRPEDRAVNLTSLTSTMVLDYRNDPFNPKDGFFLSSSVKWANHLLGSGENFLKGYFQGSFFIPFIDDIVVALGFRLGVSEVFDEDKLLPPSERFFAGGSNTLRAYPLDSVGPIDEQTGYPTGGNAMLISNAEIRFPVWGNLGLVLFYDAGSVFEHSKDISFKNLSQSAGVGLRYNTPVGPLRIDFGLNPENFDENQVFISIGHTF